MILIGQYDSPFVRRVGVALTLYGMAFEQKPWSVFADAERIRPHNPLTRVPVLVLPDGESLIDSHMILDHLDRQVAADEALFPADGAARRRALRVAALACGAGDKAVSLFYELRLHDKASEVVVARSCGQIGGALGELESDLGRQPSHLWHGTRPGHADIAVACVWRFISEAHPGLIDLSPYPVLAAHSARMEATPAFRLISQPFIAPA